MAPEMHVCDGVRVRTVAMSRREPTWNVDMPRRPVTCTFQHMKSNLGPLEDSALAIRGERHLIYFAWSTIC